MYIKLNNRYNCIIVSHIYKYINEINCKYIKAETETKILTLLETEQVAQTKPYDDDKVVVWILPFLYDADNNL